MARPWRIQYEGAIYHVMSRCVGSGKIFLANDDYSRFPKYVASAKEKFKLDIFAFISMGNHYLCEASHKYLLHITLSSFTSHTGRKPFTIHAACIGSVHTEIQS